MKTPDPTSLVSPDMQSMIVIASRLDLDAYQYRRMLDRWLDEKARYLDDITLTVLRSRSHHHQ